MQMRVEARQARPDESIGAVAWRGLEARERIHCAEPARSDCGSKELESGSGAIVVGMRVMHSRDERRTTSDGRGTRERRRARAVRRVTEEARAIDEQPFTVSKIKERAQV